MREMISKRDSHSERESEEHLQKVWIHSDGRCLSCWSDRSDCQLINERSQVRRQRSGRRSQGTREEDSTNSTKPHRLHSGIHTQDRWIGDSIPWIECMASYPRSRSFHG